MAGARTSAEPEEPRRRGRPALGRTAPLERDDILEQALAIVRQDGREALTMRRLATDLGVTPMALYHHVADKQSLMAALIDRVWAEVLREPPSVDGDVIDFMVAMAVRTREVWLRHFDLANLAVAVAEPDEEFLRSTRELAAAFELAGFPDVPLAYSAVQNFIMGSIQVAANRQAASEFFGRDPRKVRARARRLLGKHDASDNHRGVVEARFDEGDDALFEPALRALIAGLCAV